MIVRCARGEAKELPLRPIFDRRIKLEFHGARITSDGGLLAYRELDDAFGLTDVAITQLFDGRRGKNTRPKLGGLFRQSVFGRPAGYEDVNDAERLSRDPAMRAIVGREGLDRAAAWSSQMGRFETAWLATKANLEALTDLSGSWIDRVHERKPPRTIILDMDSSESPTHGEQEGSVWNGHFGCTCYHPLFVFNQFGDLERCVLRPGNAHSAEEWHRVLEPVLARYRERGTIGGSSLLPRRCSLRQARDLRAAGGGGHPLRHPIAGQPGVAAADQLFADAAGRPSTQAADRVLRQLPLPSRRLEPGTSGGGRGCLKSRARRGQGRGCRLEFHVRLLVGG